MNLGLEASAIVVRLPATATNTNTRELAGLASEMAAVALKPIAFFFFMVLLVEILPEIDWELHEILEVLRPSWRRRTFSFPFLALAVPSSSFRPLGARSRSRESKHGRTSAKRRLFLSTSARRSGAGLFQIGNTFLQRLQLGATRRRRSIGDRNELEPMLHTMFCIAKSGPEGCLNTVLLLLAKTKKLLCVTRTHTRDKKRTKRGRLMHGLQLLCRS